MRVILFPITVLIALITSSCTHVAVRTSTTRWDAKDDTIDRCLVVAYPQVFDNDNEAQVTRWAGEWFSQGLAEKGIPSQLFTTRVQKLDFSRLIFEEARKAGFEYVVVVTYDRFKHASRFATGMSAYRFQWYRTGTSEPIAEYDISAEHQSFNKKKQTQLIFDKMYSSMLDSDRRLKREQ